MMKTEQGFTLVEMLIATAITGLIIGVLGVILRIAAGRSHEPTIKRHLSL